MHKTLHLQNDKRFLNIQISTSQDKECNCYYIYISFLLHKDPIQNHYAFFQKSTLNIKSTSKKIRSSSLPNHIIKVIYNYVLTLVQILMIQYYRSNILKFINMRLLNCDITLSYNLKISKRVIIIATYISLNQIKVNILFCC